MKKKLVIASVILAVIAVGVGAWVFLRDSGDDAQEGAVVRIETPGTEDLVEFVNAPGEVEPRTKVAISAKVSARIVEMPYEEGQAVTKGDAKAEPPVSPSVLVVLDATELESALKSAEASRSARAAQVEVEKLRIAAERERLKGMDASLLKAKLDLERCEELCRTKDAAQSELDSARASYDELEANRSAAERSLAATEKNLEVLGHNLEAADADIARVRDQVSYTTITSPIDGIVTRVNAKVGELAMTGTMNNAGTVIMEVADLSSMLLQVRVDEADVGKVEAGQTADVRIHAYPDEKFTGTVESVGLTHDIDSKGSRYYRTKVLLHPSEQRIYSGLTADVDVQVKTHRNILKAPSQAILGRKVEDLPEDIRDNNPNVDTAKTYAAVVYRFIDGKAVATPVKVGASDLTHTIIESGLTRDDKVVVGPYKVLEGIEHEQDIRDEDAEKKAAEGDSAAEDTDSEAQAEGQEI